MSELFGNHIVGLPTRRLKLLQDAKSNGEPCIMFAADVQVSRSLKDYENRLKDIANSVIDTNLKFERSIKLANLQSEIDYLGPFVLQTGRKILSDDMIQSKKRANIKLPDDKNISLITGSAVMPNGDIVMCDWVNSKLKVLESCDALLDSLKLNAKPFDVAVVDATTVIVTCPLKEQLQYVDVYPRLKSGRVMQLNKKCWGVHLTGDNIFTTCHNNPGQAEVRILDLDGNLLRKLGAKQDGSSMFITPSYIAVSQSKKKIFISDIDGISITCLTMDNKVIYQYKDDNMKGSLGLYCDGEDNILVCGEDSNNVQVITAEGKTQRDLITSRDGLESPYSISYRERDDTLVVGCCDSDHIFLFKLRKQNSCC